MFNSKKIKELEDRIWQLENPCEFKVGDKIKGCIIIEIKFRPKIVDWYTVWQRDYLITVFNSKTKKQEKYSTVYGSYK